jgi:hypothetical protein
MTAQGPARRNKVARHVGRCCRPQRTVAPAGRRSTADCSGMPMSRCARLGWRVVVSGAGSGDDRVCRSAPSRTPKYTRAHRATPGRADGIVQARRSSHRTKAAGVSVGDDGPLVQLVARHRCPPVAETLHCSRVASGGGTPDLATPSGPSPNRECRISGSEDRSIKEITPADESRRRRKPPSGLGG